MCYSFKTSIISYMLGLISAIFAFCTRQVVLGCLILAYAQMQLSEIMIWRGIDTNNPSLNRTGTTFGKYLLATHNFAIGIGIILSILFISKRKLILSDFIPAIVGLFFFLIIIVFVYLPRKYPDMTFPLNGDCSHQTDKCQNPDNRLQWPFPHGWYGISYLISVIIMFIWVKPKKLKFLLLAFFTITLVVSASVNPHTMGSVWCWSTSFLAPVIALLGYYMSRGVSNSDILV